MESSADTKPKLLITGWGIIMGAGMLNVIATGTPYWVYSAGLYTTDYAGLWRSCRKLIVGTAVCSELDPSLGWVKAVRAMMILSVLFICAGFACFTLKIWVLKTRQELEYLGISSTLLGALFTLVAFSRFADMKETTIKEEYDLSFSFAFSILGMLLAIAGCILAIIHIVRNRQLPSPNTLN